YPNLGHTFYPSSEWLTSIGPIQPYVLADLYAWLEAHSGLSKSNITPTTTAPITGTNTNSSSKGDFRTVSNLYSPFQIIGLYRR
ncbi:MAG: hypothetical protein WA364_09895, partial [Candidatus Nitrosopolaris sp.]